VLPLPPDARLFMAVRREQRYPITEILSQTPELPPGCQWATFLRNHDELTLEQVSDEDRDYLFAEYAKDPRMKRHMGIGRRLAPLLDGNRRLAELLYSLLLSLPGSPVIYYGDELLMGDNIYLGDPRLGAHPMQWSPDRNGGFSRADFAQLYLHRSWTLSTGSPRQRRGPAAQPRFLPPLDAPAADPNAGPCRFGRRRHGNLGLPQPLGARLRAHRSGGRRDEHLDRLEGLARGRARDRPRVGNGGGRPLRAPQKPRPAPPAERRRRCVCTTSPGSPSQLSCCFRAGAATCPSRCSGRVPFPVIGEDPYTVTLGPYGYMWFELFEPSDDEEAAGM